MSADRFVAPVQRIPRTGDLFFFKRRSGASRGQTSGRQKKPLVRVAELISHDDAFRVPPRAPRRCPWFPTELALPTTSIFRAPPVRSPVDRQLSHIVAQIPLGDGAVDVGAHDEASPAASHAFADLDVKKGERRR